MKLLFSEARADYIHYVFPYAVWAFPESGDTPADLFSHGFLPSSRSLDRFYLCRQVRIDLKKFTRSSENRRILRKGAPIKAALLPKSRFQYTSERRQFFKNYADIKFGKDVMSFERLDLLFEGAITSHLLVFTDTETESDVGTVTLFLDQGHMAYYYFAFYDLNYYSRNLGMFMMTFAVNHFAELGFRYIYLGSCYLENALYKTQFSGAQFFNGVKWSDDLKELKYLIQRAKTEQKEHLLESEEYRKLFYEQEIAEIGAASAFRLKLK